MSNLVENKEEEEEISCKEEAPGSITLPIYKKLKFDEINLANFLMSLRQNDGTLLLDKYIVKILCTYLLFSNNPIINKDISLVIGELIFNKDESKTEKQSEYSEYYINLNRCDYSQELEDKPATAAASEAKPKRRFSLFTRKISGSAAASRRSSMSYTKTLEERLNILEINKFEPISIMTEYRMNSLLSYLTIIYNRYCLTQLTVYKATEEKEFESIADPDDPRLMLRFKYKCNILSERELKTPNEYNSVLHHFFCKNRKAYKELIKNSDGTKNISQYNLFLSMIKNFFTGDYECTKVFHDIKETNLIVAEEKTTKEEIEDSKRATISSTINNDQIKNLLFPHEKEKPTVSVAEKGTTGSRLGTMTQFTDSEA
jgi:hypothetical protein